ncbi:hypothetical protein G4E67_004513 [Salmonella enterica]|nr:hypothetical protein [Salmonella enterica]
MAICKRKVIAVLSYCRIVVLSYCRIVVLSYCRIVVLSYCRIVVLSYCRIVVDWLLYSIKILSLNPLQVNH